MNQIQNSNKKLNIQASAFLKSYVQLQEIKDQLFCLLLLQVLFSKKGWKFFKKASRKIRPKENISKNQMMKINILIRKFLF